MSRKPRPNTAHVTISFRVPKGFTARQARRVLWNHNFDDLLYLETDEEEAVGAATLKPRISGASIQRGKTNPPKRRRPAACL